MGSTEVKQVIVMRKDLHMRKGKMIAQGAHASMKIVLDEMERYKSSNYSMYDMSLGSEDPLLIWLNGKFTKIAVCVNSEKELLDIMNSANSAGIRTALITDVGATEFHGVPTNTCVAIGPDFVDKIDKITGHLKLI